MQRSQLSLHHPITSIYANLSILCQNLVGRRYKRNSNKVNGIKFPFLSCKLRHIRRYLALTTVSQKLHVRFYCMYAVKRCYVYCIGEFFKIMNFS